MEDAQGGFVGLGVSIFIYVFFAFFLHVSVSVEERTALSDACMNVCLESNEY